MSHRNVDEPTSRGLYATPRWPVRLLLEHGPQLPGGRWLEPCAGEGSICYATNELRSDVRWTAVEIDGELVRDHLGPAFLRGEISHALRGDFFGFVAGCLSGRATFDVALGNPAFPDAVAFVKSCLEVAPHVVMLERLDWLSGEGRAEFWAAHVADVWVLPNRPAFRGRGQDSGDYAWFHFHPAATGRVRHLPVVSLELRRESRRQLRMLDAAPTENP